MWQRYLWPAKVLKKRKEQPEITGNMKTLEAFLETYQTLSELFGSYKTLLQEDVGNYEMSVPV